MRKIGVWRQKIIGLVWGLASFPAFCAPAFQYQLTGLPDPLLKNVQARLAPLSQEMPQAYDSQAFYRHSLIEIQKALEPSGYFKPRIQGTFHQKDHQWIAIYHVHPGPRLLITEAFLQLRGEGANNSFLLKTISALPIHTNDPLITTEYEKAKQTLFQAALTQGYLNAEITQHRIEIDRKRYTARIFLTLDTGPRYYFGNITFIQHTFNETFLRRYLSFKTGQPFSMDKMIQLKEDLSNSSYFKEVNVDQLNSDKQNHQIPVLIDLKPLPSQVYTAGIGYDTDIGVNGSVAWRDRYINRDGHRFFITAQLSQVQNSFQAFYTIPTARPLTDQITFNFALIRKIISQIAITTQQIGVSKINVLNNWTQNLFLNYQRERFNYNNLPQQSAYLLTPGVLWSNTQQPNPEINKDNYTISMRIQGATKDIASSSTFIQGEIQGNYLKVFWTDNRLVLRGDFGYTQTSQLTNFPPSLLFYAGGTESIRGYDYQQIGPAPYLVVASAEYQRRIKGNFFATTFIDIGNAFSSMPIYPKRAVGIGIMWASPLGSMELTLGKAIHDPTQQGMRLQFTMGINSL